MCPKLNQIKFKNYHKQQEVKNVIVRDFECIMKSVSERLVIIKTKYLKMYILLLALVLMLNINHILLRLCKRLCQRSIGHRNKAYRLAKQNNDIYRKR